MEVIWIFVGSWAIGAGLFGVMNALTPTPR